MSVTAATITTNLTEYSQYSSDANTIIATLTATSGAITLGESFIFSILRNSAANWPDPYKSISTKTIVATTGNVSSGILTCSFRVGIDDVDESGIARAITGTYDVVAYSGTNSTLVWSTPVRVVLVTAAEIRQDWCYGAALLAAEILMPRFQPKKITGATIVEISQESTPGVRPLALAYTTHLASSLGSIAGTTLTTTGTTTGKWEVGQVVSGSTVLSGTTITAILTGTGGAGTYTVSATQTVNATTITGTASATWTIGWDNGTPVPVVAGSNEQYVLMDEVENQYALVKINSSLLPQQTIIEKILIANAEMTDSMIAKRVELAIASVESTLGFPIEPNYYSTMPKYPNMSQDHHHQSLYWDRIGRAADYIVPLDALAWPQFKLPQQWCLKLHKLYGYHSTDRIISVDGNWWDSTVDRMSGYVSLVPSLQSMAQWTVYTHPMLAPFYMYRNIPSFWQYEATFGLPDLKAGDRAPVREWISRLAAASVLLEAGRAYQGGLGSESTGRDGLSNSRSFNPGGPYASTIQAHQQWAQVEGPKIRNKLAGVLVGMLGNS